MSEEKQVSPQQTHELLQRILSAVEPTTRKRSLEIACAIILSLATTASAWCAYQSKVWGGAQLGRANAAMRAGREQAVSSLTAVQKRTFDASMFISYMEAHLAGNQAMEQFMAQRFRPEMKVALDAWFKLNPLQDPSAPPTPFHMAEYALEETADVARQEIIVSEGLKSSREARQYSDNYVLLTVLFASVLFFGGIARSFDSVRLRKVLAAIAILMFLGTFFGLINMPVCRE